jgi:hypothetical protein
MSWAQIPCLQKVAMVTAPTQSSDVDDCKFGSSDACLHRKPAWILSLSPQLVAESRQGLLMHLRYFGLLQWAHLC